MYLNSSFWGDIELQISMYRFSWDVQDTEVCPKIGQKIRQEVISSLILLNLCLFVMVIKKKFMWLYFIFINIQTVNNSWKVR